MIYKKYELSLSLNGENIMHIARNYAGIVVFRADTLEGVKEMIDNAILEQEKLEKEKEELRKKKEELKNKKAKRGLFQAPVEESQGDSDESHLMGSHEVAEPTSSGEEVLIPQKRVTRGPDGKFISKSQLDTDEDLKKKGFWEKLTS